MGHLAEVKTSYLKHMLIALYFVFILQLAVITGLIHAFFPFLFPFTPYNLVKKVTDGTENYFIHGDSADE